MSIWLPWAPGRNSWAWEFCWGAYVKGDGVAARSAEPWDGAILTGSVVLWTLWNVCIELLGCRHVTATWTGINLGTRAMACVCPASDKLTWMCKNQVGTVHIAVTCCQLASFPAHPPAPLLIFTVVVGSLLSFSSLSSAALCFLCQSRLVALSGFVSQG